MDILIKNCDLISMSNFRARYEKNMCVYIQGDKITKIGKDVTPKPGDKIIDAEGKICMPGLINTHTHLSMSIFRETLDGYTLQDWLTKKIWPMEDKLTKEDIYFASLLSCLEMISTGTTTANDMYFMTEDTIKAVIDTGVRVQLTRTIMDTDETTKTRIEELKQLVEKFKDKNPLITLNVGIHGLYTNSINTVREMIQYANENELPVHMHFCENEKEVQDIRSMYNVNSPVDIIEREFKDTHTILAHCVELTEEEIERLSKLKINIAHCPISNLRLGCGVAKTQKMINSGINVSLGTDGQGSGSNLDLFDTMKFTALLQKGVFEDAQNMDSYKVLEMATINGAKALGLEKEIR